MNKVTSSFLTVILTFTGIANVQSAEQCPAINCDCASLPNPQWVEVCNNYETQIKESCVANANTPKDYCLVHGLNAKPLPFATKFDVAPAETSEDAKALEEKSKLLVWALNTDLDEAKEAYGKKKFARTLQILKVSDSNIGNIFQVQQQIEAFHLNKNKAGKSKKSWTKYSDNVSKYADKLREFGNQLAQRIETAETPKQKKIFTLLSRKSLRMSGRAYENAGHALAQAGRNKKAAKAWQASSDVALDLIAANKSANATKSIKFIEFQAASRLHRASLHWLMSNNLDDSVESLKRSQLYVDRSSQQNLESLVNNIKEEEGDGILSGR